jgi:hypothetical protein
VNLSGHPGGDPPFSLSIQRNAISDRTTGIIAIKSGTLSFEKKIKKSHTVIFSTVKEHKFVKGEIFQTSNSFGSRLQKTSV